MALNAWHALVRGEGMIWYMILGLLVLAWGASLLRRVLADIRLEKKPASGSENPRT